MAFGISGASSKTKQTSTNTNKATTAARNLAKGGNARVSVKASAEALAGAAPDWIIAAVVALVFLVIVALIFR